jgi:[NiFe] hydrogenase diaphorase moiety small subunit
MESQNTITIDGQTIAFKAGQTIMEIAKAAGIYIPHLCYHPDFAPHGSCRLCLVNVNGKNTSACNMQAVPGQVVLTNTEELQADRRTMVQMLFVEGNHICPGCEKTGNCQLQAVAYYVGMLAPHYRHFYPQREVDASHPDVAIDFNRCILCELCVRASREVDQKNIFGIAGRGIKARLVINSASGKLGDTTLDINDKATQVCPVGAILPKRRGFSIPIGERFYDQNSIDIVGDITNISQPE